MGCFIAYLPFLCKHTENNGFSTTDNLFMQFFQIEVVVMANQFKLSPNIVVEPDEIGQNKQQTICGKFILQPAEFYIDEYQMKSEIGIG